MKKQLLLIFFLNAVLAALSFGFADAAVTYSFSGKVTEPVISGSTKPLPNALVCLYTPFDGRTYETFSNSVGDYSINNIIVEKGKVFLSCYLEGYESQEASFDLGALGNISVFMNFELSALPSDWLMFKGSKNRVGLNFQETKAGKKLNPLWSRVKEDSGRTPAYESSPVIYKGKLYQGDFGIECFDMETGMIIWSKYDNLRSESSYIWSTPCVSHGRIYVASFGNVYCYNADTGQEIWKLFSTPLAGRKFRASPVVVNNRLYIGTLDGAETNLPPSKFYVIDAETGKIKESIDIDGGIYGSPAIEGNNLYLAVRNQINNSKDISIRCYDISAADKIVELWRKNLPYGSSDTSTPAIFQNILYYCASIEEGGSILFCMNRYTGEIAAEYRFTESTYISSPSIGYGNIYVACYDKIYCLNLQKLLIPDGKDPLVWVYKLPVVEACGINSSPILANGRIFFGAEDMFWAAFYCLDAKSGKEIWKEDHNGEGMGYSISSPAIAEGKVIFVSAHDFDWSGIYCFSEGKENKGDVSEDGEITAYDAALAAQLAVEAIILNTQQRNKAEVDGNGEVTAYDAALIAQYSVGIIDSFPVEKLKYTSP